MGTSSAGKALKYLYTNYDPDYTFRLWVNNTCHLNTYLTWSTLNKPCQEFYQGIEPGPSTRFFGNDELKNWTRILLTKHRFLPKRTRLFLIGITGTLSFLFSLFSIRSGSSCWTLSKQYLGLHQGIEPLDLEQKMSGFLFWNWTRVDNAVFQKAFLIRSEPFFDDLFLTKRPLLLFLRQIVDAFA